MLTCPSSSLLRARSGAVASPRRSTAVAWAAALALVLPAAEAAPAAERGAPGADQVWITVGADVFAAAVRQLPRPPAGPALERVAEAQGVVLARLPAAALDALSDIVHRDFGRCGGFIVHPGRAEGEARLARLRAPRAPRRALPFAIDEPEWVAALAAEVSESELLATMTDLSTLFPNRYHLHHAIWHSADWIRDLWLGYAAGRPDVTVEFYEHGLTPQPSVVLTIPGTTLPTEIVILGGHQDSTRFGCSISTNPYCVAPGADDDGSGIAVLSEAIRVALAGGFRPQRTVQFVAYAAEEVGLWGSDDIAADYRAAGADVVAVLQLDMTAYQGSVEDVAMIADYTDPELTAFVADLLETYQPGLVWTSDNCGYGCSDHASWDAQGYRAAFAFEARFDQANPFIHSVDDTVASFGSSAEHAAKFARLAMAFLVETALDGAVPPPPLFQDGFETGDLSRWSAAIP